MGDWSWYLYKALYADVVFYCWFQYKRDQICTIVGRINVLINDLKSSGQLLVFSRNPLYGGKGRDRYLFYAVGE